MENEKNKKMVEKNTIRRPGKKHNQETDEILEKKHRVQMTREQINRMRYERIKHINNRLNNKTTMYKIPSYSETEMKSDAPQEPGETIEMKVKRLIENKEPITDAAPNNLFTDRDHGVDPAYNIRTDRWEIATEAMDKVRKMKAAKKDELIKTPESDLKVVKNDDGKPEPTHGKAS